MAALNYLISNSDKINGEVLTNIIKKTFDDKGDSIIPTLAEKWFNEGHEKGVAQGTLSTAHQYLVEILETRFHVVPISVATRINELDNPDTLNRLIKKAVVVDSMADFEAFLINTHH
ncbi:MAG: hypothetical protein HQK57_08405 [Deltaproteobacteria bacterium]|nr:hypothetical protein [Deltaproteobacteria bacterium]MBF0526870.1 hypothetical protein [Deltaproteobacteria bacterium]